MRVCVFCSSHTDLPEPIVEAGRALAALLVRQGHTLVYGGSRRGLMEIVAQSVRSGGGRVTGVLPRYMIEKGVASGCIDERVEVADLGERKQKMAESSDVFVVLPGGVGTLDELMTVYASEVVGEYKKPVYLLNIQRFWDPLLRLFDHFEQVGTSRQGLFQKRITVVDSVDELAVLLEQKRAE